jgi:hypothetical protein
VALCGDAQWRGAYYRIASVMVRYRYRWMQFSIELLSPG